jgi:hypothetical protein
MRDIGDCQIIARDEAKASAKARQFASFVEAVRAKSQARHSGPE